MTFLYKIHITPHYVNLGLLKFWDIVKRYMTLCTCLFLCDHLCDDKPCNFFNEHDRKIAFEANKKTVNFLDVTLNLSNGTYMPYTKENNIPLYVNRKSNHPPRIIENIPQSINKRLSEISYDEDSFNKASPLYQKALDDSGYKYRLTFLPPPTTRPTCSTKKNRLREII